jgi:hypothetical protein
MATPLPSNKKRKASEDESSHHTGKRVIHHLTPSYSTLADNAQAKKQWMVHRSNDPDRSAKSREIEPGDSGIWVTCELGKEARCVTEMRILFEEVGTACVTFFWRI